MAELSLRQIADRLNAEFTGDTRKLVFWYDDKGEFAEDMQDLILQNAEVYFLEPDNQFYTKYFLERVDTATNYLIYAPFPKPDVKDNHLEDTLLYSKRFFADRTSLLCVDLGIDENVKPVVEKYRKFFNEKKRTQRFYDLEIENFNETSILVGMMAALCNARTCSFEEVVRIVLTEDGLEDNSFLIDFEKQDLLPAFWKFCEQEFGYTDSKPTLEKLVVVLFVTYTAKTLQADLPGPWKPFQSYKSGNSIAFLNYLMNSVLCRERFDELSAHVSNRLNVRSVLSSYLPEDYIECDAFLAIDQLLLKWMLDRLTSEDTGAKLGTLTIPEICEKRLKMHFGSVMEQAYLVLENAYTLITAANYTCPNTFKEIIAQYQKNDYRIDAAYRHFYTAYDRLSDSGEFETLRELAENIYTNEYLSVQLPTWNEGMKSEGASDVLPLQRNFYVRNIKNARERTVVIISDAMRYEVAQELYTKIQDAPKCVFAKLEPQLGVLPSCTRLGMAALLPHRSITMTDEYQVLADDALCNDLNGREKVLKSHESNSVCLQFDDIKSLKQKALRELIAGKQVVYIYHNQIDARGDKANTEDEVFVACDEAVTEIYELIHRIAVGANTIHFIVTADHGFLYKRDAVQESDKISIPAGKNAFVNRRFIVSSEPVTGDGIENLSMGDILQNDDVRAVSFPVGANVFKVAGGGQNYVHGGSSPQEMLVPVLDVRMEKGHMESRNAQIAMVSMTRKITSKITVLDFIQSEPVGDTVRSAAYKLFFLSDTNERISNEVTLFADSRELDSQKRIYRLKFQFKDRKYDRQKEYYLVVCDESTGLEVFRQPMMIDLAFADDFGFSL